MTKKDMAQQIAEATGLPQVQVKEIVQRVFDGIIATLAEDGRIELRNFGVFEVNPRTGEKVDVPARLAVTFKPGREMLEQIRSQQEPGNGGF